MHIYTNYFYLIIVIFFCILFATDGAWTLKAWTLRSWTPPPLRAWTLLLSPPLRAWTLRAWTLLLSATTEILNTATIRQRCSVNAGAIRHHSERERWCYWDPEHCHRSERERCHYPPLLRAWTLPAMERERWCYPPPLRAWTLPAMERERWCYPPPLRAWKLLLSASDAAWKILYLIYINTHIHKSGIF